MAIDIQTTLMWAKSNIREIAQAKERMITFLIEHNNLNPLYDAKFLHNCDISTIMDNVEYVLKKEKENKCVNALQT